MEEGDFAITDDSFFDKYKNNLHRYYNSEIIIKVINDGVTRISPNMAKMFSIYKNNNDDIKSINGKYYEEYRRSMNEVKKKLFGNKTVESDNNSKTNVETNVEPNVEPNEPQKNYQEVNQRTRRSY